MSSSSALWQQQHIALAIVVIVLAVMVGLFFWRGGRKQDERPETPEEDLKHRYARGEIDEETYEHMLRELRK